MGCEVPLRKSCWGQSWASGPPLTGVPGRGMGDRPPGWACGPCRGTQASPEVWQAPPGKSWDLCHVPVPTLGTGGRGCKDFRDCHISWPVLLLVPTKGPAAPAAQQWEKGAAPPHPSGASPGSMGSGRLLPLRDVGTGEGCRLAMLFLWSPVALRPL